jgi:polyvinyl alcohol dehydrogenase (cytochrome)
MRSLTARPRTIARTAVIVTTLATCVAAQEFPPRFDEPYSTLDARRQRLVDDWVARSPELLDERFHRSRHHPDRDPHGERASISQSAHVSGEAVYRERCAGCHDLVTARIPPRAALQKMSPARILRALDFGVMMNIASPLGRDEREAVAEFLGKGPADPLPPASAYCADRTVRIGTLAKARWNGWSPSDDNTRFQTGEQARLTAADVPRLGLKWAFAFTGDITAFAQPTVLEGHLFVGSAGGVVYALDAASACIRWMFQAHGPVRSAIVAVLAGERQTLLFSDQIGWFYAVDGTAGTLIWKTRVEDHEATRLTGASIVRDGVVFIPVASWEETRALGASYPCCTFRGSVVALRVSDGSLVWKTYMIHDEPKALGKNSSGTQQWGPSGAGVWGTPTVDARRGLLYVATGDNYSTPATDTSDAVMALDLKSGRIVWSRQVTSGDAYNVACTDKGANCPREKGPDYDFGSSALLVKTASGRDLIIAGQKSGVVTAFDPEGHGEIVWQTRVGKGGPNGGIQWGMASDGRTVYAAVSDVVRIRKASADPLNVSAYTLDPREGGGLTALRVEDGRKEWYAPPAPCSQRPGCSPGQSAAITSIPGVVFSGSLDGHLRAFASEDGHVLWDFDTVGEYDAVNGGKGRGGSLDGPGPVVVNGLVLVSSGYSRFGGMPGNVLLAFERK